MDEKTNEAFEVNLKDGKVVGIARTTAVADKKKRLRMVAALMTRLPAPTSKAVGKSASAYGWRSGKDARFLMVLDNGLMGSPPMVMQLIGNQDDLKLLNYRVDDVVTTVKQLDMASEAMKSAPGLKKGRARK